MLRGNAYRNLGDKLMHLMPCAFCSSDRVELWTETDGNGVVTDSWVECDKCNAKGPMCDTEEDAASSWNVPGVAILKLMQTKG